MSTQQNSVKAYQQTDTYSNVLYADPHSLITQMFDGAVKRIAQSKGSIEHNDIAGKGVLIGKAIDIISSLDGCLDHDKGGELSTNLSNLYTYMNLKLSEANIHNDVEKLDEVIKLILEIKSAWVQIAPGKEQKVG